MQKREAADANFFLALACPNEMGERQVVPITLVARSFNMFHQKMIDRDIS